MSEDSEPTPASTPPEVIPPEISELNAILEKMVSGQDVGEDLNACCRKIQEKSRSLLVEHYRREVERIEEMERQRNLQKQMYDQRINFILDSCQVVAGNSLSRQMTLMAGLNQPLVPIQVPAPVTIDAATSCSFVAGGDGGLQQPSNNSKGAVATDPPKKEPDSTPTPIPAAAEPQALEEDVAPTPSPPISSKRMPKPTAKKLSTVVPTRVITRLPVEKHGFNSARFHAGFFCICGQELSSKCNLRRHIKLYTQKEKLFACGNCAKSFVSLNLLKKHQKDIHKMEDLNKGTIGCSDCGKIFANHLLHRRHRRKCHNIGKRASFKK